MKVKNFKEMSPLELQIVEAAYLIEESRCSKCGAENDLVSIESQPYNWWGTDITMLVINYEICCGTNDRNVYVSWESMIKAYFRFLLKGA